MGINRNILYNTFMANLVTNAIMAHTLKTKGGMTFFNFIVSKYIWHAVAAFRNW